MLFVKDKNFYKLVTRLVIPITIQNVMMLLLNMMDTIMLGQLGEKSEEAISAANLANQPFFVYTLFIFGIISGASVLISQYWGKKDIKTINSICGIALIASMGIGSIFVLVCYIFTPQVMSIFTQSANIIDLGTQYLRIVLLSYIPAALTSLLCGIMKSVEQVKLALIVNSTAILTNIFLNYVLIFGKLGFPELGIVGAARATLIARLVEITMVLIYIVFIDKRLKLRLCNMFSIKMVLVRDFVKYSLPVVFNETLWGLGITFHAAILGNLSEEAFAAYTVANVIEKIGLLTAMGFASASAIIIGKEIGAGNKDKVYQYGKTLLTLSTIMGVMMSVVILCIRWPVIGVFNISDNTKTMAGNIIIVMSILIFTKAFNTPNIVGVIRGGGDTMFSLIMDTVPMWLFSIPLGFLAAYVFKLPVHFVYACLMSDEVIKVFFGIYRFKSKKWIKNITR